MRYRLRAIDRQPLPLIWRLPDLLAICSGVILLLLLGVLFLAYFFEVEPDALTAEFSSWAVLLTAVSFCVPVFFVGWFRQVDWNELGWQALTIHEVLFDIAVGIAIIPVMSLLAQGVVFFLGDSFENPQIDLILPDEISSVEMVLLAFLIGIVTPFAEEWLFRGVLHRWLRQHLRFGWAVLLSSMIFGLFHALLPLIIPTAVLGFVCAWAYERSGSLWSAIIIHAVNNLVQVVALYIAFVYNLPIG